jgi:hypothetical protein
MAYGGIVLPARDLQRLDALFTTWRFTNKFGAGEMKWEKVSRQSSPSTNRSSTSMSVTATATAHDVSTLRGRASGALR